MSDLRDWKSDPETGELVFDEGDIVMVSDEQGDPASIRQDVEERLRLVRGEWFLSDPSSTSPDDGVDLFGRVLVKGARPSVVASIYREAILATPGVSGITSLTVKIIPSTRQARIDWVASTDAGLISGSTTIGG